MTESEAPFPADLPSSLTDPEIIRAHDWAAFQALDTMRNHWDRPGWDAGQQYYYWFLTFNNRELKSLVMTCQGAVEGLPFEVVPLDGIHLTLSRIGPRAGFGPEELEKLKEMAQEVCNEIEPIWISAGPVTGSRGAVRFTVAPWNDLLNVNDRLHSCTRTLVASDRVPNLRPHIGVAYSRSKTPTDLVGRSLEPLRELPVVKLKVDVVELVLLSRGQRAYSWRNVHRVHLKG